MTVVSGRIQSEGLITENPAKPDSLEDKKEVRPQKKCARESRRSTPRPREGVQLGGINKREIRSLKASRLIKKEI